MVSRKTIGLAEQKWTSGLDIDLHQERKKNFIKILVEVFPLKRDFEKEDFPVKGLKAIDFAKSLKCNLSGALFQKFTIDL